MSWQLLILGNIAFASFSYLCYRSLAKKSHSLDRALAISAGFYLTQYIPVLFLIFVTNNSYFEQAWRYLPWVVGGGIGFAIGNFFIYKMLCYLDAGLSSLLSTMSIIFTLSFAFLILHERLDYRQVIGSIILLSSIIYVLLLARRRGKHRSHPKAWLYGLFFALVFGVVYGAAAVNEKYLIGRMTMETYLIYGWGAQVIAAQAIALVSRPLSYKLLLHPRTANLVLSGGVLRGFAGILYLAALKANNNVSLTQIIANFKIVTIILLGAWLLKEHHKLKEKLAAAAVAIIGLGIILWK